MPFFAQRTQNLNLFWPILLRVYALFGVLLHGDNVPKLTNVRYALGSSELDKMIELHEEPVHVAKKREESTAGKSKNHVLPSKKMSCHLKDQDCFQFPNV